MIMISLSVMRSGVHARPMGFFEEELGFGRREKRIVGIRRVPGLGRGIRVLNKPHLYSHRERERERERGQAGVALFLLSCVYYLNQKYHSFHSNPGLYMYICSLSLSLRTGMPFQIFLDFPCPYVLWDEQMELSTKLKVWCRSNLGKWKAWGNKISK